MFSPIRPGPGGAAEDASQAKGKNMDQLVQSFSHWWYWVVIGIAALILVCKFCPRYKIAPPDTALIISGLFRRRYKVRNPDGSTATKLFGYRIVRGGATFIIPCMEKVDKLNLSLMQVDIKTAFPVPTKEYISVLVDAVANIKIGSDDLSIATAAEQLLSYTPDQIKALAKDVLEGNMREIIGQMTIAELVQNRDKFAQESIKAAMSDMSNMGLEIINMTIQNFSDKDGKVIETMSTQNIVDKERDAKIAAAQAEQEAHRAQVEADTLKAAQDKELAIQRAAFKMESDTKKAQADTAYEIEKERVRKTLEAEHAAAELLRLQKQTELETQQVEIQRQKLNVEIRERAIAEKDSRIALAQAERFERQAKADADLYEAQKAAEAIEVRGAAEADAILKKAEAMKQYGQAAMLEMVIEKLPDVARAIGEPLSQTEKIILFGEGATTGLTRDISGSMLQTFEALKAATGMDIPDMLKKVSEGGLVGKSISEKTETEE